ncbi:hypothetical protein HQ535_07090 [bacterium]|nr:hypothetical protein [bacterium]
MRFDRRTLLGAGLAAAAALTAFAATRPPPSEPILVAATALAPGEPLSDGALAVRRVGSGSGMVEGDDPSDLTGWILSAPLEEGEPLVPSQLLPPQRRTAPDVMAIELASPAAVGGRLHGGDLVDIYLTSGSGPGGDQETGRIARSVTVVEVLVEEGFGTSGQIAVLLAVDDDLAEVMASAVHAGHIDLVRVGR